MEPGQFVCGAVASAAEVFNGRADGAGGCSSGDFVSDELWGVAAAPVGGCAGDGVQPQPADAV